MLKKTHECFTVSVEDKIAHIVLNRPQAMNAMNKAFWNELPEIVNEINASAAARVIVISSAGKHFSAGMDLSVFGQDGAVTQGKVDRHVAAEAFRSNIKQIQSSFNALEDARMPVLIACQGGVIGGAIDMISAGDIRWCTKDAFFCIQETNIAMTADVGLRYSLIYRKPSLFRASKTNSCCTPFLKSTPTTGHISYLEDKRTKSIQAVLLFISVKAKVFNPFSLAKASRSSGFIVPYLKL